MAGPARSGRGEAGRGRRAPQPGCEGRDRGTRRDHPQRDPADRDGGDRAAAGDLRREPARACSGSGNPPRTATTTPNGTRSARTAPKPSSTTTRCSRSSGPVSASTPTARARVRAGGRDPRRRGRPREPGRLRVDRRGPGPDLDPVGRTPRMRRHDPPRGHRQGRGTAAPGPEEAALQPARNAAPWRPGMAGARSPAAGHRSRGPRRITSTGGNATTDEPTSRTASCCARSTTT